MIISELTFWDHHFEFGDHSWFIKLFIEKSNICAEEYGSSGFHSFKKNCLPKLLLIFTIIKGTEVLGKKEFRPRLWLDSAPAELLLNKELFLSGLKAWCLNRIHHE